MAAFTPIHAFRRRTSCTQFLVLFDNKTRPSLHLANVCDTGCISSLFSDNIDELQERICFTPRFMYKTRVLLKKN